MNDTLDRVEAVALKALRARKENPFLGGQPLQGSIPPTARPIMAMTVGYVQHIDMAALATCANEMNARLWVEALPGTFVHRKSNILYVEGAELTTEQASRICAAFTCAKTRTFDQDPRFGLIVLSEIASRALSPAVNDPGSAIAVIGRLVRILSEWETPVAIQVKHPAINVRGLAVKDLIDDAFRPIARDGAAMVEVQLRLHKALIALTLMCPETFTEDARAMSSNAWKRSQLAGLPDHELGMIEPFVLTK